VPTEPENLARGAARRWPWRKRCLYSHRRDEVVHELAITAAIRNPPIVYARQANLTTGSQKVSIGTVAPPQARELKDVAL